MLLFQERRVMDKCDETFKCKKCLAVCRFKYFPRNKEKAWECVQGQMTAKEIDAWKWVVGRKENIQNTSDLERIAKKKGIILLRGEFDSKILNGKEYKEDREKTRKEFAEALIAKYGCIPKL